VTGDTLALQHHSGGRTQCPVVLLPLESSRAEVINGGVGLGGTVERGGGGNAPDFHFPSEVDVHSEKVCSRGKKRKKRGVTHDSTKKKLHAIDVDVEDILPKLEEDRGRIMDKESS